MAEFPSVIYLFFRQIHQVFESIYYQHPDKQQGGDLSFMFMLSNAPDTKPAPGPVQK